MSLLYKTLLSAIIDTIHLIVTNYLNLLLLLLMASNFVSERWETIVPKAGDGFQMQNLID